MAGAKYGVGTTNTMWRLHIVSCDGLRDPLTAQNPSYSALAPDSKASLTQVQERMALLTARVAQLERLNNLPTDRPSDDTKKTGASNVNLHSSKSRAKGSENAKVKLAFRATVMRVDSCRLLIDNKDTYTSIGGGFVVGMAFLKGANTETVITLALDTCCVLHASCIVSASLTGGTNG